MDLAVAALVAGQLVQLAVSAELSSIAAATAEAAT
jgi:hypothetical protein